MLKTLLLMREIKCAKDKEMSLQVVRGCLKNRSPHKLRFFMKIRRLFPEKTRVREYVFVGVFLEI